MIVYTDNLTYLSNTYSAIKHNGVLTILTVTSVKSDKRPFLNVKKSETLENQPLNVKNED